MILTINLSRYYGLLPAVRDLTLEVQPGEIFGFLGPNGAGKTTTIRMIVGLLRPTSGTVLVEGHDVLREPRAVKQRIGYAAQTPLLYDKLTGREFLRFLGGLYRLDEATIAARTERLFHLLDLGEHGDHLIESYSGGTRRKISLCGSLIHEPRVLVLDEPLAGLDPHSARRVKRLLRQRCDLGHTVFLSTHVLEVAERVCDRVAILDKGQLVAVGDVRTLRSLTFTTPDSTLEDLFIRLTKNTASNDLIPEPAGTLAQGV